MATVYRRGKTWWGRVQRDGVEHRRSLKTPLERVARERLRAWLNELDRIAFGGKPRRTYDEAMLRFIDEHLPTLRPKSRQRYLVSIAALTDTLEGAPLAEIGSARLAQFEQSRRLAGRRIAARWIGKRRPKPITPATIRRDLACLSSMFGLCIDWEWVEHNPVPAYLRARRKRGLRESQPRRRWLTREEEAKLLHACRFDKDGKERTYTLADGRVIPEGRELAEAVAVAIDTGLRLEEQLGAKRPQLRLDRNQIDVTEGTKNARAREVPLLPRARAILAQKPAQLRSPYLFTNPETGTRYRALNKGLAGAAKRAGIAPLNWHDLRRTCGCRLLQDHGMSMEQVSRWLGHSSVLVTERTYAFLETEHLHAAMAAGTKPGTGTADNAG